MKNRQETKLRLELHNCEVEALGASGRNDENRKWWYWGKAEGIKKTLKILGHKLEE